MSGWLPEGPRLAAFAAASLALAVTPGPGVLYIVARSVTQGRLAALASVAGVAAGNWCNALGAAIGLAALFGLSSMAFTAVKTAGAVYLIYLGIRTLRGRGSAARRGGPAPPPSGRVFRDGVVVAALNPKTALFFAAFLPQFMRPGANETLQAVVLGSLFVAIAALTDTLYALTASSASRVLGRSALARRAGRGLASGALLGLGIHALVAGQRPTS